MFMKKWLKKFCCGCSNDVKKIKEEETRETQTPDEIKIQASSQTPNRVGFTVVPRVVQSSERRFFQNANREDQMIGGWVHSVGRYSVPSHALPTMDFAEIDFDGHPLDTPRGPRVWST